MLLQGTAIIKPAVDFNKRKQSASQSLCRIEDQACTFALTPKYFKAFLSLTCNTLSSLGSFSVKQISDLLTIAMFILKGIYQSKI